ncbi:MAG: DUF115 domain-containing protein [bacterium]|nr:DUF115 domain-containing protein [bacterium]
MNKNHEDIDIIATSSGKLTLKYKDTWIHSKYDPEKEAKRLIEDINYKKIDVFILLGVGLGYHLEELLKNISSSGLIIAIEKEKRIHEAALNVWKEKNFLSSPQVIFFVDQDVSLITKIIFEKFSFIKHKGLRVIEFRPCISLNLEYYQTLKKKIGEVVDYKITQNLTLSSFGCLWQENVCRNLKEIIENSGVVNLFQKFKNIPAFIIAAGPSLDKNAYQLKNIKNKGVVICVDTALKVLKNLNILPDLVVSVDPQEKNYKKLEGLNCHDTFLVVADITYWKIPLISLKKFIYTTNHPFYLYLLDVIGQKGVLSSAGGSVATVSMDLANKMGCNPIILVGQDLSFSDGFSHAKETYQVKEQIENLSKFYTLEMVQREILINKASLTVKGNYQEKVATNKLMDGYRKWIENEINRYKGYPEVINATEGGAYIEGTKVCTLQEVIKKYCQKELLVREIIEKGNRKIEKINRRKLKERIDDLQIQLDDLELLCKEMLNLYQDFRKNTQEKSYFHRIAKIEKKIFEKQSILSILEIIFYNHAFHKLQKVKKIEEEEDFYFNWHFIWYQELINSCITLKNMLNLCLY